MLSPASSDQVTLLNLTVADKKLEELPVYKDLLQLFITQEVAIPGCCCCVCDVTSWQPVSRLFGVLGQVCILSPWASL